ncbi:UPF0236 family transposase-like protein [Anoxybacillus flavithermus]|uniref:UPF0236 family transposase-like protein n=1 Tax=Anoxybacillus flavithermus TaxID=33934 RepID=UPI0039B00F13
MSHETIRQSIIEAEVEGHRAMEKKGARVFIEADGLYVNVTKPHQGKKKRSSRFTKDGENGKRVSLVNRRYMVIKRMNRFGKL